jgi:pSer/pThr/pTyr-binding forkhead associated (FHA) protein
MSIDGELVIGRTGADLNIDDPELSRRHAALRPVEGGVEIEDLGSTNGTLVNGARISEPVTVTTGAAVEIGESRIAVELDLDEEPASAAGTRGGGPGAPRSRLVIALGVLVAVAALAVVAVLLFGGESEETEARKLAARASLPKLSAPAAFQVSGVLTGEPVGRTAVVVQRRLGGNLQPGGEPVPVRGFMLVTAPDGNFSLNFDGTLQISRQGVERMRASGAAGNGSREFEDITGRFKLTGGANAEARSAAYRLSGELEY